METSVPLPLEGRRALVTGGARRIGAAIVRALAAAGATVWVHCNRSRAEAEALLATLGPRAGGLLRADLASRSACERLYREAMDRSGGIDIWVDNAALFVPDSAPDADLDRQHEVNLGAPMRFLFQMAADNVPACVVFLLDARIARPESADAPFAGYTLGKRKLASLIGKSAADLAEIRLRLNGIAPGDVLPPEGCRERARPVPLGNRPTPDDIARAVVFLAATPSITGQILFLDSGLHLSPA